MHVLCIMFIWQMLYMINYDKLQYKLLRAYRINCICVYGDVKNSDNTFAGLIYSFVLSMF